MSGFGDAHDQVYGENAQHKSSWSHELIAGAAAFEAAKTYESSHPGGSVRAIAMNPLPSLLRKLKKGPS